MSALPAGWKPFALGVLAGVIVTVWTGFDALGWKTSTAAQRQAEQISGNAVVATEAQICDAQFRKQKDFEARIAELRKADRYSRGELVAKAGWATMPGAKEPKQAVGQACAELLIPDKP